jgi:hypothetical protein
MIRTQPAVTACALALLMGASSARAGFVAGDMYVSSRGGNLHPGSRIPALVFAGKAAIITCRPQPR